MIKLLVALLSFFSITVNANNYKTLNMPDENTLPYFEKGDLNPTWIKKEQGKDKFLRIQDFDLISNQKEKFSSEDLKGKVSAVHFFFATCNGYCPTMTKNIKHAFEKYKGSSFVNFVSMSVTPEIDQMSVMQKYANDYEINESNWHLVRGNRNVIYTIAREQLQADLDVDLKKSEDQFVHSESVYLVDKDLFVRGIYNGNKKLSMLKMAEDMKMLLD